MIPPTVTHSPSRRSASCASGQSTLSSHRLAHGLERVRGDEQADRLLLDREQLGLLELLAGIGGWLGRGERAAAPLPAPVVGAAEVEDRALADQRVLLRPPARPPAPARAPQHPLARRAGRAERAALDERLDRLLVDGAVVDALAEVPDRGERPSSLARRLIASTAAKPTPFTASSPKRILPSMTMNSWSDSLTSGGRISIPICFGLRDEERDLVLRVLITEEISAAMYSAG